VTRPCDVSGCRRGADLFCRVLPPVPADIAPAVYLCVMHADVWTRVLWSEYRADGTVTTP
jgi:hypothetical protein